MIPETFLVGGINAIFTLFCEILVNIKSMVLQSKCQGGKKCVCTPCAGLWPHLRLCGCKLSFLFTEAPELGLKVWSTARGVGCPTPLSVEHRYVQNKLGFEEQTCGNSISFFSCKSPNKKAVVEIFKNFVV